MGRYQQKKQEKKWEIHPVWRGIGCIFILLIPVMSYAIGTLLVLENFDRGWIALPADLLRTISLPYLGPVRYLLANLVFTFAIAVLLFTFITIVYSIMYSMLGPSRYGQYDVPPPKRRGKIKKSR